MGHGQLNDQIYFKPINRFYVFFLSVCKDKILLQRLGIYLDVMTDLTDGMIDRYTDYNEVENGK